MDGTASRFKIPDGAITRKYIEVWHHPDGGKELRLNGIVLPYSTCARLQEIDQSAIAGNKRLRLIRE